MLVFWGTQAKAEVRLRVVKAFRVDATVLQSAGWKPACLVMVTVMVGVELQAAKGGEGGKEGEGGGVGGGVGKGGGMEETGG